MITLFLAILLLPLRALGGTVQHSYDDAGRLVGATYGNGTQIVYTYDNAGNRITKEVFSGDACPGRLDEDQDVDGLDLAILLPVVGA